MARAARTLKLNTEHSFTSVSPPPSMPFAFHTDSVAWTLKKLIYEGQVTVRFMPFIFIFQEWDGDPTKKIP
jgi:hypothetical protein